MPRDEMLSADILRSAHPAARAGSNGTLERLEADPDRQAMTPVARDDES